MERFFQMHPDDLSFFAGAHKSSSSVLIARHENAAFSVHYTRFRANTLSNKYCCYIGIWHTIPNSVTFRIRILSQSSRKYDSQFLINAIISSSSGRRCTKKCSLAFCDVKSSWRIRWAFSLSAGAFFVFLSAPDKLHSQCEPMFMVARDHNWNVFQREPGCPFRWHWSRLRFPVKNFSFKLTLNFRSAYLFWIKQILLRHPIIIRISSLCAQP